jgi:hypothetical protein
MKNNNWKVYTFINDKEETIDKTIAENYFEALSQVEGADARTGFYSETL